MRTDTDVALFLSDSLFLESDLSILYYLNFLR